MVLPCSRAGGGDGGASALVLQCFSAPVLVVMFICNHCPFVVHIRRELVRAAQTGLKRMAHVGAAKTISTRRSAPLTGGSGSTKRWGAVMTIPWSLATGLPALHQA